MANTQIQINIGLIALTAGLVLGAYFMVGSKEAEIKEKAAQGCMEVSQYKFEDGSGVTTVEPIMKSVEKCMETKGY